MEEVKKIANISSEETEETSISDLPNHKNDESNTVEVRKFNWTSLYGKLETGEYEFLLSEDKCETIKIAFTIDANGKVSYQQAEIL